MINVTNDFKTRTKKIKQQNIKLGIVDGEITVKEVHFMTVKQFNALPVWMLRKRQEVIAKELKYSFEGNLFKTIMKQIEITVKNAGELKDKNVNFQYGIYVNNDFEYIDLGDYYIKDVEDDKGKTELIVTGYDKMIHFMKTFKQSELQLTYPCTMLTLVQKMCEVCGVELYSTNFFNADLSVDEDYFTAQELTYRDVLEKVAESTLTTIFIKDNKLYLHKLADNPVEKLDSSYLTGLTVKEKFGPVNALVLGRGDVEDNVEAKDDTSIAQNGRCEIRFDENEFVEYQREQVIDEMFEQIKGIQYYAFEGSDVGVMWLEPCDLIEVENAEESTYKTIYLKANITINTGISSDIEAEVPEATNTEYKVTTKEEKKTLKVERLAKKNEGQIQDLIQETTEQGQKLTKVEQTVDGITQKVSSVETKVETVEEKADTAQDTANTANNNAQKAQNSANAAQSTANNAQNTADEAITQIETTTEKISEIEQTVDNITQTVSSVETKIETVEDKVDNAQNTADSATQKAENAQTSANNAQSTANTANTNAQNAQKTADGAVTQITTTNQKVSQIEQTVSGITQSVSEVEERIETVETKADNAQSSANTANQNAQDAQTTADNINNNLQQNYYTKTQTNSQIQQTADSINQTIQQNVQETNRISGELEEQSSKITEIEASVEGITQTVQDIENVTEIAEGNKTIILEDCVEGNLLELHIYGNNEVFDYLYPSDDLYPADNLYPYGDSRIVVTDEDDNSTIYELGVTDVLRKSGEIYDEYVLKDGKASVIRRINNDGTIKTQETIEELGEYSIKVAEGTNTLTIQNYTANMSVKYAIQNDYTEIFATKVEMNSSITQTAEEINLEVRKKVDADEVVSTINQSAEQITLKSNRLVVESDNFQLSENGNVTCKSATMEDVVCKNFTIKNSTIQEGFIELKSTGGNSSFSVTDTSTDRLNSELSASLLNFNSNLSRNVAQIGVDSASGNGFVSVTGVAECSNLVQTSKKEKKKYIKRTDKKAVELIRKSDICQYQLKGEKPTGYRHYGLVIGENYNCPNEVISESGKGVEIYSMVALAWKAIQEQQEIIENLEKRIKEMEEQ